MEQQPPDTIYENKYKMYLFFDMYIWYLLISAWKNLKEFNTM